MGCLEQPHDESTKANANHNADQKSQNNTGLDPGWQPPLRLITRLGFTPGRNGTQDRNPHCLLHIGGRAQDIRLQPFQAKDNDGA